MSQPSTPLSRSDTLAVARIVECRDTGPIYDALVRSGRLAARTDAAGIAVLRLAAGAHTIIVTRIGVR